MRPNEPDQPNISERYRTLLTLWFAICMSVFMFLVFIYFKPVPANENRQLTLALNTLGLLPVALSFLLKQKVLAKSVESQRLDLVQQGYVLSFALCESSALLGVLDHFTTGSRYYYFAFLIAGIGLVLHFPLKQNLLNASSYRSL